MRRSGLPIAAFAFLYPALASAAAPDGRQIVEHGSAGGAPPCESCHGEGLAGNKGIMAPALAGDAADYILRRLDHYAGPEGHNAAMKQVANALTAEERHAVARYVATLPMPGGMKPHR